MATEPAMRNMSSSTPRALDPAKQPSVDASPADLAVVVPTFNEAANIGELVARVATALEGQRWEIVFVDDDSPDGTSATVREIARRDARIRVVQRIGRRGLSSACIEGILATAAPYVAVMDADLQHDEALLPRMRAMLEGNSADLVIGSRYVPGGGVGDWSQDRQQKSRLATALSNRVLSVPVQDPMSGFFMARRDVFEERIRELSGMGFKILFDLLTASERPLRIQEIPYQFRNRSAGESKLDAAVAWEFLMLLADRAVGRWIPARFVAFAAVGGVGVVVHFAALTVALQLVGLPFAFGQAGATALTMVFNFGVNNALTYRDRKLRGLQWWRGLLSFMLVCSVGAAANVGVASYLFEHRTGWAIAGFAGILVGAVWNYAVTGAYTWGNKARTP